MIWGTASLSRMEGSFSQEVREPLHVKDKLFPSEDVSSSRKEPRARKALEHLSNKRPVWLQHCEGGTIEKLRQNVLSRLTQFHRPEDTPPPFFFLTLCLASCDIPLVAWVLHFPFTPLSGGWHSLWLRQPVTWLLEWETCIHKSLNLR